MGTQAGEFFEITEDVISVDEVVSRLADPANGAVATFVGVDKDGLKLTAGEFGRIESSAGVYRSFCSRCGTPMAYETDELPGEIHLYLGTLERPDEISPTLEVFCRERLPWLQLAVDGPSFEGLPVQEPS